MADKGPFCAPVEQNGGQKGQSAAAPFKIVIKSIIWSSQSFFAIFKIYPIFGHTGGHLGV